MTLSPRLGLAAVGLVLAAAGVAQTPPPPPPLQDEPTLVVTGQARRQVRLAFPASRFAPDLAGDELYAAQEIEQTLRADLDAMRVFNVQGPTELSVLVLTGANDHDFEQYRSLGNEVILTAEVAREDGKLVLVGRVFDLASRQAIDGKRYRGPADQARRIAHSFADWLHHLFTGRAGIALTSIAFQSTRDGFQELYLMDYDGRNQRRITGHRSTTGYPAWSPKSDVLGYVSFFSGGGAGIYLVDLPSGGKKTVYDGGVLNLSPTFSPDGERLVFAHAGDDGNVDLYVCERACGQPRRITDARSIDTNPAWSPQGGQIAFTSDRSGQPQVYVMNAEGGEVRRISFEGDYNDGASWGPDGTLLAYASRRDGRRFQIAVTSLVDLATRLVTEGAESSEEPSFAPDGNALTFTRRRGREAQVFVVDVEGGNLRQLTHEGNNSAPSWQALPPSNP